MNQAIVCVLVACSVSCVSPPATALVDQSLCTEQDKYDEDYEHCQPPLYVETHEYLNSVTGSSTEGQTESKCQPYGNPGGRSCKVRLDLNGVTIKAVCSGHVPNYEPSCWSVACPPAPIDECSIH